MKWKVLLLVSIVLLGVCSCNSGGKVTPLTATGIVMPSVTESLTISSVPTSTTIHKSSTDVTLENDEDFAEYQEFLEDERASECWDKAITQVDMTLCAGQQAEQSESMLNQFLEEYNRVLDDEARSKLRQVQVLWEKYKQQDCQRIFESYNGGTLGPMNRNLCWDMYNRHRLESLIAERRSN